MPVTRINRIRNVGVLEDPIRGDQAVEIGDACLIYAENGRGKSTLSALLDSLGTGDTSRLHRRRTASSSSEISAIVSSDTGTHTLANGEWSLRADGLLVFDSTFIDRHISSGSMVLPTHRASLLTFLLGDAVAQLEHARNELRSERNNVTERIEELEREIERLCGPVDVQQFCLLENQDDVDKRVEEAEQLLSERRSIAAVHARPMFATISQLGLDWESVVACARDDIDQIARRGAELVIDHIHRHAHPGFETWLREGTAYATDNCPFCGQVLESSTVAAQLSAFFTGEYQQTLADVEQLRSDADAAFAELLSEVQDACDSAVRAATAWVDVVPNDLAIPERRSVVDLLQLTERAVVTVLDTKRDNPANAVGDGEIQSASDHLQQLSTLIGSFNFGAMSGNDSINAYKARLDAGSVDEAHEVVEHLKRVRLRYSDAVRPLADELGQLYVKSESLLGAIQQATSDLRDASSATLEGFREDVNRVLGAIGASFRVTDLDQTHYRQQGRVDYQLAVDELRVRMTEDSSGDAPSYWEVLSDGDRRTLAIAMFIARTQSLDLAGRTIVVDDPVASLDLHRQNFVINWLVGLVRDGAVPIVMSHDPTFLRNLERALGQLRRDRSNQPRRPVHVRSYRLVRGNAGRSIIEGCILHEVASWQHVRDYRLLRSYVGSAQGTDQVQVLEALRRYVEHAITTRFPLELSTNLTLGRILRALREPSLESYVREALHRHQSLLDELNAFTAPAAHGGEDAYRDPTQLSDAQVQAMVERGLNFTYGLSELTGS